MTNKIYHSAPDDVTAMVRLFMALYTPVSVLVAFYHPEPVIIPFLLMFFFVYDLIGIMSAKRCFQKL